MQIEELNVGCVELGGTHSTWMVASIVWQPTQQHTRQVQYSSGDCTVRLSLFGCVGAYAGQKTIQRR